jgi:ribonuclease HI
MVLPREILASRIWSSYKRQTLDTFSTSWMNIWDMIQTTRVELWGLVRGIQMASDLNMTHLIIEGDSKVIINLVAKIINGNDPEKSLQVGVSWVP